MTLIENRIRWSKDGGYFYIEVVPTNGCTVSWSVVHAKDAEIVWEVYREDVP